VVASKSDIETKRFQYLLGLCDPAERERIESEYFHDENAFQQMLTAEDDLIDAYARGELTAEQRQRFETHFLTSLRGRDRVQFARVFGEAVVDGRTHEATPQISHKHLLIPIAAIAAVVVVLVLSWLFVAHKQTQNDHRAEEPVDERGKEPSQTVTANVDKPIQQKVTAGNQEAARQQRITPRPSQNTESPNTNIADATIGNTFDRRMVSELAAVGNNVASLLSLTPQLPGFFSLQPTPAKDVNTIKLSSSTYSVILSLRLDKSTEYSDYGAVIEAAGGGRITSFHWRVPSNANHESVDTPVITTDKLSTGKYWLYLTAEDANGSAVRVAEYSFTVIRK
jgi:hypothetical protein